MMAQPAAGGIVGTDENACGRHRSDTHLSYPARSAPAATTWVPCLLPGVALPIAQGFEFVNGFHGTAKAARARMLLAGVLYWLFAKLFRFTPPQAARSPGIARAAGS